MSDSTPLIVSASFGNRDFARLDGLRRAHFPPDRNQLPAHLTLFHHLPPSVEREARDLLRALTLHRPAPLARLAGPMTLGRGVALRVESDGLSEIRALVADRFAGLLMPQDAEPWRPHVTIQNKVSPAEAAALLARLKEEFAPRPLAIAGLALWRYRGGPWQPVAAYAFSRPAAPRNRDRRR